MNSSGYYDLLRHVWNHSIVPKDEMSQPTIYNTTKIEHLTLLTQHSRECSLSKPLCKEFRSSSVHDHCISNSSKHIFHKGSRLAISTHLHPNPMGPEGIWQRCEKRPSPWLDVKPRCHEIVRFRQHLMANSEALLQQKKIHYNKPW